MSEITALLLCKLGGQSGSADEIKAVLEAAGVEANDDQITKLVGDTEGKDINELLAAGAEKIKDVPFGGGGGGGGGYVECNQSENNSSVTVWTRRSSHAKTCLCCHGNVLESSFSHPSFPLFSTFLQRCCCWRRFWSCRRSRKGRRARRRRSSTCYGCVRRR